MGGAPTGVQQGQPPDGPHSGRWDHGEDNDVPKHLAPQSDVFIHDDEMVQPTRVRRLASEALLFQQMQNQLTSSLGVGSLASLGTPSLHATVVAPVFRGGAVAVIKRFKVVLAWAAPTPKGLSFMCSCGGERGAFCVETHVKKGESSSCGHADALRKAFFGLAAQTGHTTLTSLVASYPDLVATHTLREAPFIEKVCCSRGGRDVWAVCAMGDWCALVQAVKLAASQVPR